MTARPGPSLSYCALGSVGVQRYIRKPPLISKHLDVMCMYQWVGPCCWTLGWPRPWPAFLATVAFAHWKCRRWSGRRLVLSSQGLQAALIHT